MSFVLQLYYSTFHGSAKPQLEMETIISFMYCKWPQKCL